MKTNITKEDAIQLREEFLRYADNAEPHFYPILIMLNIKLDQSIDRIDTMSVEEKNAMFRTVYKVIGKDYSEYEKNTKNEG